MNQKELNLINIYNYNQYFLNLLKYSLNLHSQYLVFLVNEINKMYAFNQYFVNQLNRIKLMNDSNLRNKNTFTIDDLSYYDGTKGKPAYVAVNGIVYDVSLEATWGGGTHFKLFSGNDLSEHFNLHHDIEVLKKLPIVGNLIEQVEKSNE